MLQREPAKTGLPVAMGPTLTQTGAMGYGVMTATAQRTDQSSSVQAFGLNLYPAIAVGATLQPCPLCGRSSSTPKIPSLDELTMPELMGAFADIQLTYAGRSVLISRPSHGSAPFAIPTLAETNRTAFWWLMAPAIATLGTAISGALMRWTAQRQEKLPYEDWDVLPVRSDSGLNSFALAMLRYSSSDSEEEVW